MQKALQPKQDRFGPDAAVYMLQNCPFIWKKEQQEVLLLIQVPQINTLYLAPATHAEVLGLICPPCGGTWVLHNC